MFCIRRDSFVVLCLMFVFVGISSTNAEMIYQSVRRTIVASGTQLESEVRTSDGVDPFVDDLLVSGYIRDESNAIVGSVSTTASQTSTLAPEQIRGLGRGSGFASGPGEGSGRTEMSVQFEVKEDTQFILNGQLRLAPHGAGLSLNDSSAMLRISGPDGPIMEVLMNEEHPPNNFGVVDFSGNNRLMGDFVPGVYLLEAYADGHGSDGLSRCADFEFSFTALAAAAVPEPTTGTMSLTLVAVLWLGRRRAR